MLGCREGGNGGMGKEGEGRAIGSKGQREGERQYGDKREGGREGEGVREGQDSRHSNRSLLCSEVELWEGGGVGGDKR